MEFHVFKKIQNFFLYTLVLYALLGFFLLPYVIKSQLVSVVKKQTNATINIESVYFNPFIFRLEISGIKLSSKDAKELFALESLSVNLEVISLVQSAIHIKDFTLQKPEVFVVYNKDKTFNLSTIAKKSSAQDESIDQESSELPRIILDKVSVVDGALYYEDYSNKSKFDFSFNNIGFELKDIDTNDFNSSDASMRFYSSLGDGGFVDIKSNITGFKPLKVEGSVNFEASKLYTQWRYLQDSLKLEVADGKLSFYTDYSVNVDDLNSTKLYNLTLYLEKLRIKPKEKYKDILNLESFYITNTTVLPMLQDLHIGSVALDSLYLKVKRDENLSIDWLEYLKSNTQDEKRSTQLTQDDNASNQKQWHLLVDTIALQKIQVDFYDRGISPQVDTKLDELNLYMQNVTLAGKEPWSYQLDTQLNKTFKCTSEGKIVHNVLDIHSYIACRDFDLVHYKPYLDKAATESLSVYDVDLQSLLLGFDANIEVKQHKKEFALALHKGNFTMEHLLLHKRSTHEKLVGFEMAALKGIELDTYQKDIFIEQVVLDQLNIALAKEKEGALSIDNVIVTKSSEQKEHTKKSTSATDTNNTPYTLFVKHFALDLTSLDFSDKTFSPTLKHSIDRFNLDAYDINSSADTWMHYKSSLRVNGSGTLSSQGKVRHTPLKYKGSLEVKQFSLQELSPYVEQNTYVNIADGYVNTKSTIEYENLQNKPDLRVQGVLSIDEFFANDYRDNTSLLSFTKLALKPFTLEMFPKRLYIKEVDLDSFYLNAIVYKDKQINFASLVKPTSQKNTSNEKEELVKLQEEKNSFPVKIMKLNVKNGSAQFADLSLPLKFKTNIHDLNGVVYAISSTPGETSYITIDGTVDKYGSTKLKGSINASNPKEYTDLNFNFKNLQLSSFSGYSASFAGYKIDDGKLYLDLGYKILDSELLGENSIIIKNIQLGDEVEDENVTTLPLGFVVALLEDSEGIIDIDMPVEGNVDEPDFKYGALVWKTLGNLILKAVSSPFKFLASAMGIDGADLEYAEFEAGDARILPPEQEKLDSIAKMLIKRPKIALGVGGKYDAVTDKKALQKEKLAKKVVALSGSKETQQYENLISVELLQKIYNDAKDDNKPQTIKKELSEKYTKEETLQRAYLSALLQECSDIQVVTQEELEVLAKQRAQKIKEYLVRTKNIEAKRVKLLEVGISEEENEKLVKNELKIEVE